MSILSLFEKATQYARYYADVVAIVPSEPVKTALAREGWQFKPSEYVDAMMTASQHPGLYSNGLPLEDVMTNTGINVYKSDNPDMINRYEAAKKKAAARTHGINL